MGRGEGGHRPMGVLFSEGNGPSRDGRRFGKRTGSVMEDQLEEQGVLNVKRLIALSAVAAASLAVAALIFSDASAQSPGHGAGRSAGPSNVALIDVQYIFKNHPRFKAQMAEMRKDVEAAEAQVQQRSEEIRQRAQDLERYKGSPQYKAKEREIADAQAQMAIDVRSQKRDFLQREAKIYHNTYIEIWQAVDYFCKQNGIAMVLRFSGERADTENPEEVLRDINKPIVWHQNSLDITEYIMRDLNRGGSPGSSGGRVGERPSRGTVPFQR